VWVLERIRPHLRMVLPHAGAVRALAYSPDGHMLVTAGDDPSVRVWDVTALTPSVRVEVPGHAGGTRQLLVTPDGNTLVTAGGDGRANRWNLRTGKLQSVWEMPPGRHPSFAFTADGRYLARGTTTGGIEMYRVAESRT
jgi:WD40 repeat protein